MKLARIANSCVVISVATACVFGTVAIAQTLLSGVLSTVGCPAVSSWWRLPLSITDILVDKHHRVYTSNDGSRIQVYASDGSFLNGWSFGKDVKLLLGPDAESIIAVRNNQPTVRFDVAGNALAQWSDPGRYVAVSQARTQHGAWRPAYADGEGNVYYQEGWILHRIVRVDDEGNKAVIVRDPIHVGILNARVGMLLVLCSFVAWRVRARVLKHRSRSPSPNASVARPG